MIQNTKYKVIIVGAGPAGLAASLTLLAYKIPHCLIDANISATIKPGDALPPNAKPLFKQLGIIDFLNSPHHIPYYGNKSIWGINEIHEKEFIESIHGHGYILDRLHFENQLRKLVKSKMVPFYKGYQVKKVYNQKNKVEVVVRNHSERIILESEYIIDATGRKASVCRHLGINKIELDSQMTISFWHELQGNIPRQIWIEATENGWWYLSPNASNQVNCMFFTMKEIIPKGKDLLPFLRAELFRTQHIKDIVKPSDKELREIKMMPSGTSCLKQPYGKNWLAIGDAAFSYDPISSYGITSAIATGFYGAHAVAGQLANEEDAFLAYRYILENGAKSYLKKLNHQYDMEKRWENSFYWKNRLKQV